MCDAVDVLQALQYGFAMRAKAGGIVVHPDNHRVKTFQVLRKPPSLQGVILILLDIHSGLLSFDLTVKQHYSLLGKAQDGQLGRVGVAQHNSKQRSRGMTSSPPAHASSHGPLHNHTETEQHAQLYEVVS